MAIVLCLLMVVGYVSAYPQGAPLEACKDMYPVGHNVDAENSDPPYTITTNTTDYENSVLVTLTAQNGGYFEGVFIQARRAQCGDSHDEPLGTYSLETSDAQARLKLMDCALGTGSKNALTHKDKVKKMILQFVWMPTSTVNGTVYFRGTFVKETDEFWTNVSSRFVHAPQGTSVTPVKCTVRTTLKDSAGITLTPIPYILSALFSLVVYTFTSTTQ